MSIHAARLRALYLCAFVALCLLAAGGRASADDGTSTLTSDGAAECLYNRCDPATASWAFSHLTPQPMATLGQAPPAVAWRERPSTYAVCTDDNIVHPDLQRVMARRCSSSIEWPTDHSPFLSTPNLVADVLIDLAQSTS